MKQLQKAINNCIYIVTLLYIFMFIICVQDTCLVWGMLGNFHNKHT